MAYNYTQVIGLLYILLLCIMCNHAGIVPVTCEELFKGIESKVNDDIEFQVVLSMLEIYNEQVRDLLNPTSNVKGGLKVREHPSRGFYGKKRHSYTECMHSYIIN